MPIMSPNRDNTLVIIPARMASTRLPGKPLAEIAGKPMIVQVWNRAMEANIGRVLVAAAEPEVADAIQAVGGDVVLTDPDLPSGSDRIAAAMAQYEQGDGAQYIINLQGDLPTIDPQAICACLDAFTHHDCDMTTLTAPIEHDDEIENPNVVKVLVEFSGSETTAIAQNFVRTLPEAHCPPYWHHIGLYGYRRKALEKFVSLPVSEREKTEKLEQLRALDNGMTIAVARVDIIPFGVDAPEDLARAREILGKQT